MYVLSFGTDYYGPFETRDQAREWGLKEISPLGKFSINYLNSPNITSDNLEPEIISDDEKTLLRARFEEFKASRK